MAANKVTLEKVLQSAFKNKKAGSDIATSILGIEAMILSGIAVTTITHNADVKFLGRCRSGVCHKEYGKRLADAVSTLNAIIIAESLTVTPRDLPLVPSTNKAKLRAVSIHCFARVDVGITVADIASETVEVVDLLMVVYAAVPATLAALTAIRAILVA